MTLSRSLTSATVGLCLLAAGGAPAHGQCESKLLPSDGVGSDFAGQAVSIDGDRAIVGAASHNHGDGLGPIGGAWIFRWDGSAWIEEQELLPSDREADLGHAFGQSVSIHGDVLIVGAGNDDEREAHAGAAYVFRWDGDAWIEEQKLTALDADRVDFFGSSVHIRDDVAVIGAVNAKTDGDNFGAAYVFRRDGATWAQEQKLIASDPLRQALFGNAVARDGDVIVIGADHDGRHAPNGGAAYVFRWNGGAWLQERKLTSSSPAYTDEYGGAVAISGDVIVVGCDRDDDLGTDSGSAFVYRWSGATWVEEQKLTASDGFGWDNFGCAVAVVADDLVVGAQRDDDLGRNCGAVYVFRRDGGIWSETGKLLASDAGIDDGLGYKVGLSGARVVAGAPHDDDTGSAAGAAYVFDLLACACTEDLDGSGEVATGDLVQLLAAWGPCGGCPEDLDDDGIVGVSDLIALLAAWGPCA